MREWLVFVFVLFFPQRCSYGYLHTDIVSMSISCPVNLHCVFFASLCNVSLCVKFPDAFPPHFAMQINRFSSKGTGDWETHYCSALKNHESQTK